VTITKRGIHVTGGGRGERLLVLLHGMGANATVWDPLIPLIDASWDGRWIAPDLRGHGRSLHEGPYGFGMHAADVADLLAVEEPAMVTLAGHSFGGVVAALVASGWFGPRVHDVAAFGVKIEWTPEETQRALETSRRPARVFAARDEAIDRYLKFSGLSGLVDPASAVASAGVLETDGGFRVAMDPRAYGAVGPPVEGVLRLADPPVRLAAGSKDPMVTLDQMRRIDPAAQVFDGAGHNAHWEATEQVWQFITGRR
jgi:pimeloyl-ACP methyl ester carboxylesterase